MEKKLRNFQLKPILYRHEKEVEKGGCRDQRDYQLFTLNTLICIVPNPLKETVSEWMARDKALPEKTLRSTIDSNLKRATNSQLIDLYLMYQAAIWMVLTFHTEVTAQIIVQALHQQLGYPARPKVIDGTLTYILHLDTQHSSFQATEHATKDIADFISVIQPALQVAAEKKQNYPKRPSFFHTSYLTSLCKKYKLPDESVASLEKGLRNAANNNQLTDIKLFLTADIDINAADPKQHKTALYWADCKGWNDCAQYLQAHGATI